MEAGSEEPGAATVGVRTGPVATLVDRLTGETVAIDAGRPAADTLAARISESCAPTRAK